MRPFLITIFELYLHTEYHRRVGAGRGFSALGFSWDRSQNTQNSTLISILKINKISFKWSVNVCMRYVSRGTKYRFIDHYAIHPLSSPWVLNQIKYFIVMRLLARTVRCMIYFRGHSLYLRSGAFYTFSWMKKSPYKEYLILGITIKTKNNGNCLSKNTIN